MMFGMALLAVAFVVLYKESGWTSLLVVAIALMGLVGCCCETMI